MFKVNRNVLVNMVNKFKVNNKDFCCHLNSEGNIKRRRKKAAKEVKWRQKDMKRLGMILLGFRTDVLM